MRLFRRRRGKHALGAAVTAIPSGPLPAAPVAAPLPPWEAPPSVVFTPVAPEVVDEIAQLIATGEAWRDAAPAPAPSVLPAAQPVPARIQLGFRDGTSAVLDPRSSQAQALEELAQSLTHRD